MKNQIEENSTQMTQIEQIKAAKIRPNSLVRNVKQRSAKNSVQPKAKTAFSYQLSAKN